MTRRALLLLAAAVAASLLLSAGLAWRAVRSDPDVRLLLPERGAEWIGLRWADGPKTRGWSNYAAIFRTRVRLEQRPARALLHLHAFRYAVVFVDGESVGHTSRTQRRWKQPITLDLAPHLGAGEHEIALSAINTIGPPMVLAWSEDLGIATGAGWQAKADHTDGWVPAVTAGSPQVNSIGEALPRSPTGSSQAEIPPRICQSGPYRT